MTNANAIRRYADVLTEVGHLGTGTGSTKAEGNMQGGHGYTTLD